MNRSGLNSRVLIISAVMIAALIAPSLCFGEDFKTFTSEEYGFTIKYPATWVKVEPKNYYLVFQSPDQINGTRSRIHIAAHKPVKDPLNVYLQELRQGIADLQKKGGNQAAQIIDEGEFKSEVPGAYYFFLQAFDKVWQDVVIVFFKHDQTLLRISCLTASQQMEKLQPIFNEVLTSVRFVDQAAQPSAPASVQPPATTRPQQPAQQQYQQQPAVQQFQPPAPAARPTQPGSTTVQPAQPQQMRPAQPTAPAPDTEPDQEEEVQQPARPAQPPQPPARQAPRGPSRGPERPGTGIVN